eukprot:1977458-Rhodomonas_salina.3
MALRQPRDVSEALSAPSTGWCPRRLRMRAERARLTELPILLGASGARLALQGGIRHRLPCNPAPSPMSNRAMVACKGSGSCEHGHGQAKLVTVIAAGLVCMITGKEMLGRSPAAVLSWYLARTGSRRGGAAPRSVGLRSSTECARRKARSGWVER